MPLVETQPLTELLHAIDAGKTSAWNALVNSVHGELRRIAHARLARHRPGDSVNTTLLVQETYANLLGRAELGMHSRKHFFAAVSRAMRDLLVDEARRRQRLKRGGDDGRAGAWQRVSLTNDLVADASGEESLLALNEALERLEREDALQHQIVQLRYFAGLTIDAVAEALNTSASTVDRQWKFARAWLQRELNRGEADG